jgi:hypothetical protein
MTLARATIYYGDRVLSERWGEGTVTRVTDHYVDVAFDLDQPKARDSSCHWGFRGWSRSDHKSQLTKLGVVYHPYLV